MIKAAVYEDSEAGKQAQAVVAGVMDAFAGVERAESGRVNDPSRKHHGDGCVRSVSNPDFWDKAIEVRDKPVAVYDVHIARNCAAMNVRKAAVVMVAEDQQELDAVALQAWATELGVGLTLFQGWDLFVEQVLFWADPPKPESASQAVGFVHERLIGVEASPNAVILWDKLTR